MNPKEYKLRTHEPDVFVRHALEDTLRALSDCVAPQGALVELIEAILAGPIIEKPERHRDRVGEESDFISVGRVSKEDALAISDVFFDLEAACVDANGEITGLGGYYAGLSDAWRNYAEAQSCIAHPQSGVVAVKLSSREEAGEARLTDRDDGPPAPRPWRTAR